jgi:hypothetical protein
MSTRVAKLLEEQAGFKFDRCMTRLCTAFNNCKIADKMSTLAVTFVNNNTKHLITFKVLEIPYDLIVGRRDIWRCNLWPRFAPFPYNEQYKHVLEHTRLCKTSAQNEPINYNEINIISTNKALKIAKATSTTARSSQPLTTTLPKIKHPLRTVELRETAKGGSNTLTVKQHKKTLNTPSSNHIEESR